MKSRDRVIKALDHQEPDRCPIDFTGEASIQVESYRTLKRYLGFGDLVDECIGVFAMEGIDDRILSRFHVDFRVVGLAGTSVRHSELQQDMTIKDEWGVEWKRHKEYFWISHHPLGNALNSAQIHEHTWPDDTVDRAKGLNREAQALENAGWAVAATQPYGGIYEAAQWLRGHKQFAIDMYRRPDFTRALLDRILKSQMTLYAQLLDAVGENVQTVWVSDDLGTQTSLSMNPTHYREYIKPRQKKLFDFIRQRTDAKIVLHCDGAIKPLINDLIEIGVDVLNPVQPQITGMESEALKLEYGDRISFHGGVNGQRILPFGSPDDVTSEVRRRIRALGQGGGYVIAPPPVLSDVRPENIVALFDSAYKLGRYPLTTKEKT